MDAALTGSLACTLYLISASVQYIGLTRALSARRLVVVGAATAAIVLHGLFCYQAIYTSAGINIGFYPMTSLTSLAIAAILVVSSMRRPVENLFIVLFLFAIFSILLALWQDGAYTPRTDISATMLLHIALSVIAYSILAIAAFQAGLLSIGDYKLKHRNLTVLKRMPPLQTMESLLFELIWSGLVFLSLSICSGFVYLGKIAVPGLIHHTVITLAAWAVFSILLWGRYKLGWRGAVASRWTLAGFMLLLLGYFGSKIVLELFLERA